ncbi:MAG: glycosyltransferase family 39 protein [Planctomycetes bacterium]|nr:glycosyltransferase family 39 protein [Planctomycetota bacterium]
MTRSPWSLLLLALTMRVVGCVLRPIPARDGVAYLWMAEQWAANGLGALFDNVFHPLYPFTVGLLLQASPGQLDTVVAGQIVAAGCSTLAVLPIHFSTRRLFGDRAALWAGVMFAIGAWFVRHPAECLSEGPFHLGVALWAAALLAPKPRALLAGVAAGAAFLARPEGLALVPAGMLLLARRDTVRAAFGHAIAATLVTALQPFGSLWTGHGFVLTPKAAFNWEVGAGGASSPLGHYLENLWQVPGDAWEGLGYLVFPMMLGGVVWRWRRGLDAREVALLLPFAVQCAVFPLLRSNLRFVSGFGVLLLPFAGLAFATLLQRWRWRWLLVLLLVASEAKLWLGHPADRTVERDLGRWLATQMSPADTLASDMPRLWFFAHRRPPPPRVIRPEDLVRWAQQPSCRFVALRRGRSDAALPGLVQAGFAVVELPAGLRDAPDAGSLQLWQRSP